MGDGAPPAGGGRARGPQRRRVHAGGRHPLPRCHAGPRRHGRPRAAVQPGPVPGLRPGAPWPDLGWDI